MAKKKKPPKNADPAVVSAAPSKLASPAPPAPPTPKAPLAPDAPLASASSRPLEPPLEKQAASSSVSKPKEGGEGGLIGFLAQILVFFLELLHGKDPDKAKRTGLFSFFVVFGYGLCSFGLIAAVVFYPTTLPAFLTGLLFFALFASWLGISFFLPAPSAYQNILLAAASVVWLLSLLSWDSRVEDLPAYAHVRSAKVQQGMAPWEALSSPAGAIFSFRDTEIQTDFQKERRTNVRAPERRGRQRHAAYTEVDIAAPFVAKGWKKDQMIYAWVLCRYRIEAGESESSASREESRCLAPWMKEEGIALRLPLKTDLRAIQASIQENNLLSSPQAALYERHESLEALQKKRWQALFEVGWVRGGSLFKLLAFLFFAFLLLALPEFVRKALSFAEKKKASQATS